ncbi:hypothetical protein ACP4OV_003583 [Aristida adscensionis]
MGLILNRELEKYEVEDLVLEHNHILQTAETMMPTQRSISNVQAFEIEIADASGIKPRIAHELASRHVLRSWIISTSTRKSGLNVT